MTLRKLIQEDLEMVLAWRNAPEVRRNMCTSHIISWEEHLGWFKKISSDPSIQYHIFEELQKPLGVVYFTHYNPIHANAFWGFYAGDGAPKGTGLKMEYDALEFAFSTLGLHKLNCEVIAFNQPVINMHKKVGFVEEGCFRDYYFDGNEFQDVIRLGILHSEWQNVREKLAQRIASKKVKKL